jgi:flagellar hook-length control protein FliK
VQTDAADAATAAAAAAAVAAASASKAAASATVAAPVVPQAVAAETKVDVKPAATPADEQPIDATAATDRAAPKAGADVINHIETKAAPADDNQPQLTQTQQQQAEPQLTTATPAKSTASADFAAALKEAAPAVAPAAAKAAQEIAKAATAVPTDKLSSRVGTQAWDQQLGQKIVFMAAGGEQSATMELNPPDLGPLQVVLSVNKDQATAAFSSAAPEVRQALEAALPRLKEMMGEAGIQLGSATVSAGMSDQNNGFNQQASSAQSGNGNGGNNRGGSRLGNDGGGNAPDVPRSAPPARRVPAGAVDTFA